MSTESPTSLLNRQAVLNSPLWRGCLLGLLVLLLQIPILLIHGVTSERRARQEATQEVTSKWGKSSRWRPPDCHSLPGTPQRADVGG